MPDGAGNVGGSVPTSSVRPATRAGADDRPGRLPPGLEVGVTMDLDAQFEAAAEASKNLPARPDNNTMLKLYALYKQATVGDVQGSKPGFTDPVGRAKFDAWDKLMGTDADEAKQQYIDLVNKLAGK